MANWLPDRIKTSFEKRLPIYECGINIAKNNWAYGIGFKEFEEITEICPNVDGGLITHNMFLNEFVANGVFGLVLLITIFGHLFFRAINSRNIVLLFLLIITLAVGLVEDILSRQLGVLFFVSFVSMFYAIERTNETSS